MTREPGAREKALREMREAKFEKRGRLAAKDGRALALASRNLEAKMAEAANKTRKRWKAKK